MGLHRLVSRRLGPHRDDAVAGDGHGAVRVHGDLLVHGEDGRVGQEEVADGGPAMTIDRAPEKRERAESPYGSSCPELHLRDRAAG